MKYAAFVFSKDSKHLGYKRAFNKLDEFFSYVGGLIGTILGLMLFMSKFSLTSFELDIGQRLFKFRDDEEFDFTSFNLFTYFLYLLYKAASFFKCCRSWKAMAKLEECKREMLHQLDAKFLIQRLNFLERAVESYLLSAKVSPKQFYAKEVLRNSKKRRKEFLKVQADAEDLEEQSLDSSDDETKTKKYELEKISESDPKSLQEPKNDLDDVILKTNDSIFRLKSSSDELIPKKEKKVKVERTDSINLLKEPSKVKQKLPEPECSNKTIILGGVHVDKKQTFEYI